MIPPGSVAPDAGPAAFLEAIHTSYLRAEAVARGPCDVSYRVGPGTVRLRFAGPVLIPILTRALAHLAAPDVAEPDLTVHVWDTASTGVRVPSPPRALEAVSFRGEVAGCNGGGVHTAFQPDCGVLSVVEPRRGRGFYWLRDPRNLTIAEKAAPFLRILHWWLRTRACHIVHGASVGTAEGAVLIGGPGGTGKSITALACLAAGLQYLADDYCAFSPGPRPVVFSLYGSAKSAAVDVGRLPFLGSILADAERSTDDKTLYWIARHFPARMARQLPLTALLIPRIVPGTHGSIRPASRADALRSLMPSTMRQLPGADGATIDALGRLVRALPCAHLDLGTVPAEAADAIHRVLTEGLVEDAARGEGASRSR